MAEFAFSRLFLEEAEDYINRAIHAVTRFSTHPQNGDVYYLQGLILEKSAENTRLPGFRPLELGEAGSVSVF
jgi:hypothetical protein